MIKNWYCILLFCLSSFLLHAQKGNIWCFGDSAGVDFANISNPTIFTSHSQSRGSCITISDTNGTLSFYAFTRMDVIPPNLFGVTTIVKNFLNQTILNGDSIVGESWYQELVALPTFQSQNQFYLFSLGILQYSGLYYSIVDMNLNSGLGEIVQKNTMLSNLTLNDQITAIKQGNGRDWWLFVHESFTTNFHRYLITPSGISAPTTLNIGSYHNTRFSRLIFNEQGNRALMVNYYGLIELYNFDRCTGVLSNPVTVSTENLANPKKYFGFSFSPGGQYIYVSNVDDYDYELSQYDLLAGSIAQSKIVVGQFNSQSSGGQHKLGPDGKIYLAHYYESGFFPYPDSVYNMYNMNLSVINYPDSAGTACDFQPFSFYLGGKRTYYGLPNNPDYDKGAWIGSPCDTLTGTNEYAEKETYIDIFPNPCYNKFTVSAQNLKQSKKVKVIFYDMIGNKIFETEERKLNSAEIDVGSLERGVYFIVIQSGADRYCKRLTKL